jgi:hypothetical protein
VGRDDVSSKKRAGRQVRKRLRAEAWAAVRKNARLIAGFLAVYLTVCAVAIALYHWWGRPGLGWFLGGVLVGFLPCFFTYFLLSQGIAQRQMGGDAEEWTAEELEALDRRVWRVFHDVPVRYGNVDHVAVGPGRVYAIETKWTSAGVRYLDQLAACAERQAQRLRDELSARGTSREVVPSSWCGVRGWRRSWVSSRGGSGTPASSPAATRPSGSSGWSGPLTGSRSTSPLHGPSKP